MGFPGNKKGFGSYFRLQSQATGFADLNKKYFVILFHCILMILCAAFFLKRVTSPCATVVVPQHTEKT